MKARYPFSHLRVTDPKEYWRLLRLAHPEEVKARRQRFYDSGHFTQWKRNNKLRHVKALGGKCQKCGYSKCLGALELHEISGKQIPRNRAFCLTPKVDYSKVMLLCANCHRELHYELTNFRRIEENQILQTR